MTSLAALRIFGDGLIPDEITKLLGCDPDTSRAKGQVTRGKTTGREYTAKTGSWMVEVRERDPEDLNAQIAEIFGRLNADRAVWADLASRFQLDLFCGLFMGKSSDGLSLSPESLVALGSRGIELNLCLYSPTETTDTGESEHA